MIDFLSGLACGMVLVFVVSYRLLSIAREQIKQREAEVIDMSRALDRERRIPKKRPRGEPTWPRGLKP